MVSTKLAASGSAKSMSRAPSAFRIRSLQTYSPGVQRAGCDAEREPPGGELRSLRSRRADEAVPLHDRVGQAERTRSVRDEGAGLQPPRRDRDVVGWRRNPGHPVEFHTIASSRLPSAPPRRPWHSRPSLSVNADRRGSLQAVQRLVGLRLRRAALSSAAGGASAAEVGGAWRSTLRGTSSTGVGTQWSAR